MDEDLAQKAIYAALTGSWKEAITVNSQILKLSPYDISALNRIARAYAELGDLKHARIYSTKALKVDPFNSIALKCLDKWKGIKKSENGTSSLLNGANDFIEEPGKTKIVGLLNLAGNAVIAKLDCGDYVKLTPHAHRVSVMTQDDKYIGRLTDDLAARLIQSFKSGNNFKSVIKSANKNEVKVFIKSDAKNGF